MSPSGYFPRAFATGATIGAGHTRSADIRGIRSAFDDLGYLQSPPNASPTYTPPVSSAIKRFQGDFGLKQDGVIAPDGPTEQALNFALEANRAGGKAGFEISRDAIHRLNQSGLRFIRDSSDFSAFGMWQDGHGNRVAPAEIATMLGDRFNSRRAALPDRAAETLTRIFGPGESKTKNSIARASAPGSGTTGNGGTALLATGNPAPAGRLSGSNRVQSLPKPQSRGTASPMASPTLPTKRPSSNTGDYSLSDLTNLKNSVRLKRTFEALFVDKWRSQKLFLAAANMERYLGGSAKTLTIPGPDASALKPIKRLEAENLKFFTEGVLAGNDHEEPDHRLELQKLEDGQSINISRTRNAKYKIKDFGRQVIGEDRDFALAFGRTSIDSTIQYTAKRIGDKIIYSGTITHEWKDRYDFHKGQPAADAAHELERSQGAKPFDIRSTWKQTFTGTVTITNGVVSTPQIKWK